MYAAAECFRYAVTRSPAALANARKAVDVVLFLEEVTGRNGFPARSFICKGDPMPQGGELRFESSIGGDEAEIRISDSGGGIPPEKRDKIFQLYFTTKKKGSGIGLAMTFRIVQLHNGKIDFFSEPGKGTTFILRFPLEGSAQ